MRSAGPGLDKRLSVSSGPALKLMRAGRFWKIHARPGGVGRWYGKIREELHPALDLKAILADRQALERNCKERQVNLDIHRLETLHWDYRQLTGALQQQQRLRRKLAEGFAKVADSEEVLVSLEDAQLVKEQAEGIRNKLRVVEEELGREAMAIPNSTHPSVPRGGAEHNLEVGVFGEAPKPPIRLVDHLTLGRQLDILDFEAGARTTGSSFYFLKGQGALLEQALIQYALSKAIKAGFTPILPPDIVNSKYIRACGFFPRVEECRSVMPAYVAEVDGTQDESSPLKVLAATGEIPLAAYYSNVMLDGDALPIKWVAVSHCFRPETGHTGSDSRGLYRVHQFTKVELFILKDNDPASSDAALAEIVALQAEILSGLEISCRVLNMASAELGTAAYQKYDIEAFFPCRARWGELSSASNCTDHQARRLALRYRPTASDDASGKKHLSQVPPLQFAHTLNGTACAIPRVIQAIMENHQRPDGSVAIPKALHPFMLDGSTVIRRRKSVASDSDAAGGGSSDSSGGRSEKRPVD